MTTQSDREAAAKVHPFSHNSALIRDGQRDGTDIVQAAMHSRLAILSDDRVAEVARAIVEATDGPWDWFSELGQEAARTQARAVLKTLRGEA